jgi:hypothetical protein
LYVLPATPDAVKFMALPVQTGLLLPTAGAAGTDGLTSVKGPTDVEGQEVKVTYILE